MCENIDSNTENCGINYHNKRRYISKLFDQILYLFCHDLEVIE